jgi:hypothetical protein
MDTQDLTMLVDKFGEVRDTRLAADKAAEKLKEQENLLKEQIITALRDSDSGGITGSHFGVKLQKKDKVVVTDWAPVYAYIKDNDAFDLLHKRITEGAVKLRWEDGVQIAGLETYPVYDLTVSRS